MTKSKSKSTTPVVVRMTDELKDTINQVATKYETSDGEATRKCISIGAPLAMEPSLEEQIRPVLEVVGRVAVAAGTIRKQLVEIRTILFAANATSSIPAAQKVLIKYLLKEAESVVSRAEKDRLDLKEALKALRYIVPITREEAKLLRDQVKLAADDAVDVIRKEQFERLVKMLTLLGGI